MDITRMSEEEKAEVRSHVELYKKIRPTMQLGRFYRLLTPFTGKGNETAWEFVSQDGSEIVLVYFKTLATPAAELHTLKLQALAPDALYEVSKYLPAKGLSHDGAGSKALSLEGKSFYGDELMYSGIEVPKIDTDFAAYMWIFHKK
uniref:GH36 C-terminal domain-containing protein n=1 Tax=Mitsuokella sp. TaxID=2049034 RepID=UPI003D7DBF16